jgi:hypothetical protein
MDEKTFDQLWLEGGSMNMDQAVDFAIGEQEE